VAEICNEYQISQSLYYQWREQFLAHASNAFESHQRTREKTRLERENASLKKLVGELLLELKKKRRGAGLKRQRSLQVTHRDEALLPHIQRLKAEHPFWGYRRIWAYLPLY
jgi:transposase-like protein